jgi:uncharacterized protein YutD
LIGASLGKSVYITGDFSEAQLRAFGFDAT